MSEDQDLPPTPGSLLADNFYDPQEPSQDNAPPAPDEGDTAPPAGITADPDPNVPVGDDTPPDGADEPGDGDVEPPADAPPTDVQLETFEQLAEHLEADPDVLQDLSITQKVNGEEIQVKLADALQTHRQVEAGDAYLADAKSKAKGIINDATEQKEALGESVAVMSAMMEGIEGQINTDVSETDWNQLRADDPAEYSARKLDIENRRTALDNKKQEVVDKYRNTLQQIAADEDKRRVERLPEEQTKLQELVPDWADSEKASAEQPEVVKYLREQGYTDKQIQAVSYHAPSLAMAIKARRFDLAKGKSQAAKKKVVTIPKVIKPGKKEEPSDNSKSGSADRSDILYG